MTNEEAIALLKKATLFEPKLENKDYPEAFELAIKALEARPKGKWKETGFVMEGDMYEECQCDMRTGYYCSWCGYPTFEHSNFCPNCGADMRGES